MFGTFQEERDDRKPVYGLNSQVRASGLACITAVRLWAEKTPQNRRLLFELQPVVQGTYNPLWHQIHHLVATLKLAKSGKVRATPVSLS